MPHFLEIGKFAINLDRIIKIEPVIMDLSDGAVPCFKFYFDMDKTFTATKKDCLASLRLDKLQDFWTE